MIDVFFKAMDRGELIVFEQQIDESILIPLRVEYVYELNGSQPTVKIYSEIKKIIPVPDHKTLNYLVLVRFLIVRAILLK